jgi:hypothetical protein
MWKALKVRYAGVSMVKWKRTLLSRKRRKQKWKGIGIPKMMMGGKINFNHKEVIVYDNPIMRVIVNFFLTQSEVG